MSVNIKFVSPDILPEHLINSCRTFGRFGPAYQILKILTRLSDKDALMHIRVLENGEELDYKYSSILHDPVAE